MKRSRPAGVQLGEEAARAAILAGSTKEFAKRGFSGTSVADILQRANVARRTFYRHFTGKESVALELYRIGTDILIEACERATREEPTPILQLRRCIDAHLAATRGMGRLVYVLGGEAQRPGSLLSDRRAEVHRRLLVMLDESLRRDLRKRLDPLILMSLVLALEAVPRLLMDAGDQGRAVTDEGVARARVVMMRIVTAVLQGEGAGVTPLPFV